VLAVSWPHHIGGPMSARHLLKFQPARHREDSDGQNNSLLLESRLLNGAAQRWTNRTPAAGYYGKTQHRSAAAPRIHQKVVQQSGATDSVAVFFSVA
jgi:hypothetical protein